MYPYLWHIRLCACLPYPSLLVLWLWSYLFTTPPALPPPLPPTLAIFVVLPNSTFLFPNYPKSLTSLHS
ncbi:hypothetical protein BDV28DRAFT_142823 [Aspergillus coremiiformis]|uniref:Uncharacterized protein n=1 Tax=Aspergillus coremiiformis TaxID=138285 RepID=A0A5N6YWG8_9EURO|nr:hypothetical protein BDV28DRAFT_142823 [Aspergillus coremiiformis]